VSANDFVLVQGMSDTRETLRRWNDRPWPAIRSWVAGATAVALALLFCVWLIAAVARPDPTPIYLGGIGGIPVGLVDVGSILFRNSLVLALHAMACVAGFIAGSSLALAASGRQGLSKWVHEKARPIAFAWVVAATCFSLATQAYALGSDGATLASQFEISPMVLVVTVLPHALPELIALFLPLAAWTIASRRQGWNELLAATFATTALAIPILIATASWEAFIWPRILELVSPVV
jgi:uncharacterized membrane protein